MSFFAFAPIIISYNYKQCYTLSHFLKYVYKRVIICMIAAYAKKLPLRRGMRKGSIYRHRAAKGEKAARLSR